MTFEEIPAIARERAEQLRTGSVPAPRVESSADGDIALLCEMIAVLAAAELARRETKA